MITIVAGIITREALWMPSDSEIPPPPLSTNTVRTVRAARNAALLPLVDIIGEYTYGDLCYNANGVFGVVVMSVPFYHDGKPTVEELYSVPLNKDRSDGASALRTCARTPSRRKELLDIRAADVHKLIARGWNVKIKGIDKVRLTHLANLARYVLLILGLEEVRARDIRFYVVVE